ncbi:MAG: DUF1732 domain-containing protein [Acidobacteriota bacterium]
MINSMTGYAQKRFFYPGLDFFISLKSENHRYFEWEFRSNPQIVELEKRILKIVKKEIFRGKIYINFEINFLNSDRWKINFNAFLFDKILNHYPLLKNEVIKFPEIFSLKLNESAISNEDWRKFEKGFREVLNMILKERKKEGKFIEKNLKASIGKIEFSLNNIEKNVSWHSEEVKRNLSSKIEKMLDRSPEDKGRFFEEIAYLSQRMDISEEITRIKSHVNALRKIIEIKNKISKGKNMDFLVQEILREVNTINSKTENIKIIREGLKIKAEVDKIREQARNVE